MKVKSREEKASVLVNFRLHRNVVKVLDRLVQSGLYKTRVDVVLSALRVYEPFAAMWKKEVLAPKERNEPKITPNSINPP